MHYITCDSSSKDELYELDYEMLWTGDYNMQGHSPVPPVQGGFLVVRPSLASFEEYRDIIRKVGLKGQSSDSGF
jgi:hypothetical protein